MVPKVYETEPFRQWRNSSPMSNNNEGQVHSGEAISQENNIPCENGTEWQANYDFEFALGSIHLSEQFSGWKKRKDDSSSDSETESVKRLCHGLRSTMESSKDSEE